MPAPTLGYVGQKIYDGMAPHWLSMDPDNGYSLAWLIYALTYRIDPIVTMIRDGDDGSPGWSAAVDIDRAPDDWLDWLGQFVGVVPGSEPSLPLRLKATNFILNPSFESDTIGNAPSRWTARETQSSTQRSSAVDGAWAAADLHSYRWRGVTTLTNQGVTLTSDRLTIDLGSSLYLKYVLHPTSGRFDPSHTITFYDASNVSLGTQTVASSTVSSESTVSVRFNAPPAGTSYAILAVRLTSAAAATLDLAVDVFILSSVDVPYFDGTTYLANWTGTEGYSSSVLYEPDPTRLVDAKRESIRNANNLRRGTLAALRATAQRRLTGTRKVTIVERFEGSPWKVRIVTFASETPDPAGTAADLEAIRMAGYIFEYETFYGQSYEQAQAQYGPTYADLEAAFNNYDDLRNNVPA